MNKRRITIPAAAMPSMMKLVSDSVGIAEDQIGLVVITIPCDGQVNDIADLAVHGNINLEDIEMAILGLGQQIYLHKQAGVSPVIHDEPLVN